MKLTVTPKSEESYAWENVYPELLDRDANPNPLHSNLSEVNSKKMDFMSSLRSNYLYFLEATSKETPFGVEFKLPF